MPGLILYEEYHPFGTSSSRAADSSIEVSAKRYRYIGKERDEETGLDHMGARYYAAWLGRWTAADPLGIRSDLNRYEYVNSNPVRLFDPDGQAPFDFNDIQRGLKERNGDRGSDRRSDHGTCGGN